MSVEFHGEPVIVTVKKVEIVYKGRFMDGYPTLVQIDGVETSKLDPPLYVKAIQVGAVVDGPLLIFVRYSEKTIIYEPEEFDLVLGNVRITKKIDRWPCAVFVNGLEVRTRSIDVKFAEGECVVVELSFLPESMVVLEPEDASPEYSVGDTTLPLTN